MPADITAAALVEAAARGICAASGYDPDDGTNTARNWQGFDEPARVALAATVRAAGLDAEGLRQTATTIDDRVTLRRAVEAAWAEHSWFKKATADTDNMERTAALLRALAALVDETT